MANEIEIDGSLGAQLFPDETAEEAVARIVAQNPEKHGVTLEQRKARAMELARRMAASGADLSGLSAEDALIVSVGGNPNEMMVGNKPRYTVDEAGNVKDHETGEVHRQTQAGPGGHEAGMEEIPFGQAMVESGHSHDAEGDAEVGAEQDSSSNYTAASGECPATEPGRNEAGDGVAEENQPARLVDGDGTEAVGGAAVATCQHSWPEDPQDSTPCAKCGMTFEDWANL